MRLWSIHPMYLDSKGLVACWREGLLAYNVLQGKTKGYRNHSQLIRFKETSTPLIYIQEYLSYIQIESNNRKYNFKQLFVPDDNLPRLNVTIGQLEFEFNHLLKKLEKRDEAQYIKVHGQLMIDNYNILSHPLFNIIKGEKENWERS